MNNKILMVSGAALIVAAILTSGENQTQSIARDGEQPRPSESVLSHAQERPAITLKDAPIAEVRDGVPVPDLSKSLSPRPTISDEQYVHEMASLLRRQFEHEISSVRIQASLKEFKDDIRKSHPENAELLFEKIVRLAFPNLVDDILDVVAKMERYDEWYLSSMLALNELDSDSHLQEIWKARYEHFGDDAVLIWPEDVSLAEQQERSANKVIHMLDASYEMQMLDRLNTLKTVFENHYSESVFESSIDTTSVMTQVFFRFDSVQKELAQLDPDQRQYEIDNIRRQMGYDESQIQRLSQKDQEKEKRWQNGKSYMQARAALLSEESSDDEVAKQLASLRTQFFGQDAYTIQKEEEDLGFFRYERPRVYGWN